MSAPLSEPARVTFQHIHLAQRRRSGVSYSELMSRLHEWMRQARVAGHLRPHHDYRGGAMIYLGWPQVRGATICRLEDDSGQVLATGYAFCSWQDHFNRRIGRQIAEGRARGLLRQPSLVTGARAGLGRGAPPITQEQAA